VKLTPETLSAAAAPKSQTPSAHYPDRGVGRVDRASRRESRASDPRLAVVASSAGADRRAEVIDSADRASTKAGVISPMTRDVLFAVAVG
jgi:hypothetical protein